jgi:hypothetical protein
MWHHTHIVMNLPFIGASSEIATWHLAYAVPNLPPVEMSFWPAPWKWASGLPCGTTPIKCVVLVVHAVSSLHGPHTIQIPRVLQVGAPMCRCRNATLTQVVGSCPSTHASCVLITDSTVQHQHAKVLSNITVTSCVFITDSTVQHQHVKVLSNIIVTMLCYAECWCGRPNGDTATR